MLVLDFCNIIRLVRSSIRSKAGRRRRRQASGRGEALETRALLAAFWGTGANNSNLFVTGLMPDEVLDVYRLSADEMRFELNGPDGDVWNGVPGDPAGSVTGFNNVTQVFISSTWNTSFDNIVVRPR